MAVIQQMLLAAGGEAVFVFNATIAANTQNYNLRAAAVAAGWNQTSAMAATVTINSGVYVGSSSTGSYAFDTGASLPAGSSLTLVNNGYILGAGGPSASAGGPALRAQHALTVTNNGTVGGGGGGGAVGATNSAYGCVRQNVESYCFYGAGVETVYGYGGAGGAGAGNYTTSPSSGSAGTTSAATDPTGLIYEPTCNYVGCNSEPSWTYAYGGTGYTGGALGSQGGGGGGAAGACTSGNANITWAATGTRNGALN